MEPSNFETELEVITTLRKKLIERENERENAVRTPTVFERAFTALFGRKFYNV